MKKNYYLIMLLLAVVMGSCKKEGSNTTSTDTDARSNSFYKIGTVLKFPDSNLVNSNGFKISYLARFPGVYTPGTSGTQGGALGSYTKANYEVARSINGLYSVFFQGDGNLVLYKRSSPNGPVIFDALWATNAYDSSLYTGSDPWNVHPATVQFQDDGNIVCRTPNNNVYWASNLTSGPKPIWIIQDDGNFVGYSNVSINVANNTFTIQGGAFGATFTDGGRKSNNFGGMGRTN